MRLENERIYDEQQRENERNREEERLAEQRRIAQAKSEREAAMQARIDKQLQEAKEEKVRLLELAKKEFIEKEKEKERERELERERERMRELERKNQQTLPPFPTSQLPPFTPPPQSNPSPFTSPTPSSRLPKWQLSPITSTEVVEEIVEKPVFLASPFSSPKLASKPLPLSPGRNSNENDAFQNGLNQSLAEARKLLEDKENAEREV
jgi:hypothetical protein